MIEIDLSPTLFYMASFYQETFEEPDTYESGLSIIVLGLRITWLDKPVNPLRREWCIPKSAWDDKVF